MLTLMRLSVTRKNHFDTPKGVVKFNVNIQFGQNNVCPDSDFTTSR